MNATVKSKEIANESLMLLGSRDKQWSVLDKVAVRNQQIGLVSFDLMENLDRFVFTGANVNGDPNIKHHAYVKKDPNKLFFSQLLRLFLFLESWILNGVASFVLQCYRS